MRIQSRIAKAVVAGALGMLFLALLVLNLSSGERKIDHRIPHLYSVGDPKFVRTMGSLLGAPLVSGNDVVELLNGDEIFPSMLEAIRGARRTITFETYIYWSGKIGDSFCLNDEANLNVLDSVFTARLVQTFEEDKTHSRRMTLADWRARPWTDKLLEHAAGLLRSQF